MLTEEQKEYIDSDYECILGTLAQICNQHIGDNEKYYDKDIEKTIKYIYYALQYIDENYLLKYEKKTREVIDVHIAHSLYIKDINILLSLSPKEKSFIILKKTQWKKII